MLTVEADVGPEEILVDDGDRGARGGEDAQEHVRTHHLVVPASNPRQAREDHGRSKVRRFEAYIHDMSGAQPAFP